MTTRANPCVGGRLRRQRLSGTPRKRGVPARPQKPRSTSKATRLRSYPLRVVIADDHETVRSGLRSLLEANGRHEVCGEAVNGFEAVREAKEKKPDIVLLDMRMPRMNGVEAARRISRNSPNSLLVMVTVDDSAEQIREALDAGADGYVLKRDASQELLDGLEIVRRKKRFLSSGCPRP